MNAIVPGLKGLPVVERCGALVRTKITDSDRLGGMVADCFHPHADGQLVAATVVEAINATRESGIGPAEMRRQRDELLAALKRAADYLDRCACAAIAGAEAEADALHAAIAKAEGRS